MRVNHECAIFRTAGVNLEYIPLIIPNTIHGFRTLNIRPLKKKRPEKKDG